MHTAVLSPAVLSLPPVYAVCHLQLLQLLIPDRYSFLPAFFWQPMRSRTACLVFCINGLNDVKLELLPVGV